MASPPALPAAQIALLREFHLRWRRAWATEPAVPGAPSIASARLVLERFHSATGAFGGYSFQRQTPGQYRQVQHWTHAWEGAGQWTLLRDRWVVLLRGGLKPTQLRRVLHWAAALSSGDDSRDIAPTLPLFLPSQHRVSGSLRYGYGPVALAQALPWYPAAYANFADGAEFAAAHYASPQDAVRLALWSYPTPQIADTQLQRLRQLWSAQPQFSTRRSGTWLIVAQSTNRQLAQSLLHLIHQRENISWSHIGPDEVLLAAELLFSILVFVAFLMGVSVVLGVLSGWLRVQLSKWFPRYFSRSVNSLILLDLKGYKPNTTPPDGTK